MKAKALNNYFKSFGRKVLAGAKNNLKAIDSGLASKMSFKIINKNGKVELMFTAPEYAQAVDKGVHGNKVKRYYIDYKGQRRKAPGRGYTTKAPPSDVFEKWIRKKGIKGRDKKTGRFIKRKALAFVMAKSMQMKGRQGLEFFQRPLQLEMKKINKNVMNAIRGDIRVSLTGLNNKYK